MARVPAPRCCGNSPTRWGKAAGTLCRAVRLAAVLRAVRSSIRGRCRARGYQQSGDYGQVQYEPVEAGTYKVVACCIWFERLYGRLLRGCQTLFPGRRYWLHATCPGQVSPMLSRHTEVRRGGRIRLRSKARRPCTFYVEPARVSAAATIVSSICSLVCAVETNSASNWLQGK